MRILSRFRWILPATAMAAGVWIAAAQQPKKVDNGALRNAAKNGEEWLTYGRDQSPSSRPRSSPACWLNESPPPETFLKKCLNKTASPGIHAYESQTKHAPA